MLEDVHWADAATLGLLRHVVRSGAAARMLILATFRDDEADVPAELASALVDVYRTEGVVRIRLAGLSEVDVAEFVRLTAGAEPARTSPPRSWSSPAATHSSSRSSGGSCSKRASSTSAPAGCI